MESPPHLELTIISAKGLKDIGKFSKMDVYVAVTINGDPRTEQRTPVDQDGGSSPKWSHPMKLPIHYGNGHQINLSFRLRHERLLLGDKDVGEVHVPVQELLDKLSPGDNGNAILAEFPVRSTSSGKKKGKLKFSYKIGSAHGSQYYPDHAAPAFGGPYKPPVLSLTKPYPPPGPTTGYPSGTAPAGAGYYPGAAPPAGYPVSVPLGYPSSAPDGYRPGTSAQVYHSTAPAGYPSSTAPPAGYPSAAPTAGHPGSVPLGYPSSAPAGYPGTSAQGYHSISAPSGYPVPGPPPGYQYAPGSSSSIRTESSYAYVPIPYS